MSIFEINPLSDSRWAPFLESQTDATIFHSAGWLKALHHTYGYEPFAVTTSRSGQPICNALVLCRISSWLTGSRVVSLPFSDHCQPLVGSRADLSALLQFLKVSSAERKYEYVEFRPFTVLDSQIVSQSQVSPSATYSMHMMDLRPPLEILFESFHKNAVQKVIQRATREELRIGEGQSDELLKDFYKLLLLTRRRHGIPPHPIKWFYNLFQCLGDRAIIRVAYKDQIPIASIFTLTFNQTAVYKYGCSDARYQNLGGTAFLLWRAIGKAKEQGLTAFDFGRSELDNEGLIRFKDRWGSEKSLLQYYRFSLSPSKPKVSTGKRWHVDIAQKLFSHLPDSALTLAGKFLYRHMG